MSSTKFMLVLLISCITGCVTAKVSGAGVNVHDALHGVEVQANSVNAEISDD